MWLRYGDDTFLLWPYGPEELSLFLKHINNLRPSIQFTMEVEDDGKISFLDVLGCEGQWKSTVNQLTLTGITNCTIHIKSRQALSEL